MRDGIGIVGREVALSAARRAFGATVAGVGGLTLVAGETGIGKTTLLNALSEEVDAAGGLVLRGQCWDGDGAPAYWPWVQVLRAGMAAGGDPGDAVGILPEAPGAAELSDEPDGRFRVFDGVMTFLAQLATARPVLVVLDDLQWCDEGSLRLLRFAARHLPVHSILVLGAYRDEEAGDSLRDLAATAEHIVLDGLHLEEVAALVAAVTDSTPPATLVSDIRRRTGGNPFLVRELARLLPSQPDGRLAASFTPGLGDRVQDILGRRLARLSQPCADLLTIAALCAPEVEPELLRRVAGADVDIAGLLAEAVGARILVQPTSVTEPFRFTHDLFRETIAAGLPVAARSRLHLAIGRALEDRRAAGMPVHPAQLAAHFAGAANAAPTEALRHACAAADEALERVAFEEACEHLERALVALELGGVDDAGARCSLMWRLGDARRRAGIGSARDAYRAAAGLARRRGDSAMVARAAIGMHLLGARETHGESIALLEEALAHTGDDPLLRSRLLACLARELHHSVAEQHWERASALAEEAVQLSADSGDDETSAFCLLALHDARWRPGSARQRLPVIDEMLVTAQRAGDGDMARQAQLLRAAALIELGDRDGLSELDSYCRSCERLGHPRARYGASSRRAVLALIGGDFESAVQLAEDAHRLGKSIGEADADGVRESLRWAAAHIGATAEGVTLDSDPWPWAALGEAFVCFRAGETSRAGQTLSRVRLGELPRTHDLEIMAFAVEAVAAAGSDEQRAELIDMLAPHAGTHIVVGGCASYFGAVDHHLGVLARSQGDHDAALGHFERAVVLHERLGAAGWAALSRQQLPPAPAEAAPAVARFVLEGRVWQIRYGDEHLHLPDAKGLRDLAVLLGRPGQFVHAVELNTGRPPAMGADPVLDVEAKAAYRRRLLELDAELDAADARQDRQRSARAQAEREALIRELRVAVGLAGRDRRLGDESERARKAVSARIREAVARMDGPAPKLAEHLRNSVQTGSRCGYVPAEPVRWDLVDGS